MSETTPDKVTNNDLNTPPTTVNEKPEKGKKQKKLDIIKILKIITPIAAVIVTAITCHVLERNNKITDTANLLNIYNAIQAKTDALSTINFELEALLSLYDDNKIDDIKPLLNLKHKQNTAIISFVNTFEFACLQYDKDKIDKEAFKLFYDDEAFFALLDEHKNVVESIRYPYIKKVRDKWRIEGGSR